MAHGGLSYVPKGQNQGADQALGPGGDQWESAFFPDLATLASLGWIVTITQAAAGVAPGTSATTTTPALTIWHSGTTLAGLYVIDIACGYVSGTIGQGHLMYGEVAAATAPSGGTAITAFDTKTGAANGNLSAGTGHTTTAMSASTDRFPVLNLVATLATAPAASIGCGVDDVHRVPVNKVIPGGTVGCFYGVAAGGSSPLMRLSARCIAVPTGFALPS